MSGITMFPPGVTSGNLRTLLEMSLGDRCAYSPHEPPGAKGGKQKKPKLNLIPDHRLIVACRPTGVNPGALTALAA